MHTDLLKGVRSTNPRSSVQTPGTFELPVQEGNKHVNSVQDQDLSLRFMGRNTEEEPDARALFCSAPAYDVRYAKQQRQPQQPTVSYIKHGSNSGGRSASLCSPHSPSCIND